MENTKIVEDLVVPLNQSENKARKCFVVYSSHEEHIEVVIDCIENVFNEYHDV
jgi:hypothetical protein